MARFGSPPLKDSLYRRDQRPFHHLDRTFVKCIIRIYNKKYEKDSSEVIRFYFPEVSVCELGVLEFPVRIPHGGESGQESLKPPKYGKNPEDPQK